MKLEEYVQFYLSLGEHDVTYSFKETEEWRLDILKSNFDFKIFRVLEVKEMDSDIPLLNKLLRKVTLYALETEQGFKMVFCNIGPARASHIAYELIDEE